MPAKLQFQAAVLAGRGVVGVTHELRALVIPGLQLHILALHGEERQREPCAVIGKTRLPAELVIPQCLGRELGALLEKGDDRGRQRRLAGLADRLAVHTAGLEAARYLRVDHCRIA